MEVVFTRFVRQNGVPVLPAESVSLFGQYDTFILQRAAAGDTCLLSDLISNLIRKTSSEKLNTEVNFTVRDAEIIKDAVTNDIIK
jgi:hypothetical protein